MVFDLLTFRLLAQLPESLDRQRSTLLAGHLNPRRRFVTVDLGFVHQHLDSDLDAARISFADSWLKRQEHVFTAFGVEFAVSLSLGIGKPGDAALKRSVNGLRGYAVLLGERRVFWN